MSSLHESSSRAASASSDKANNNDDASSSNNPNGNIWYFAIGSMMNPTSMKNRNITSLESKPGELLDFQLGFFNSMGFAEAIPAKGKSFHGVLHLLDKETMDRLDKLEIAYVRTDGRVRLYDGANTIIHAKVYTKENIDSLYTQVNNPPLQRYIDVMVEGARHYAVDPTHIDFLNNCTRRPRPLPHEFQSFGRVPETAPLLSFENDVLPFNGENNSDNILRASINGKVMEICLSDADHPIFKRTLHFYKIYGQAQEIIFSNVSHYFLFFVFCNDHSFFKVRGIVRCCVTVYGIVDDV